MIEGFELPFSSSAVEDLRVRILRTRWPAESTAREAVRGLTQSKLKQLCDYWITEFNWQAQLVRLAELPHFRFPASEGKIHFLHVRGKGTQPIPLLLTHGWPGSFLDFAKIIPLLTDPAAHGLQSNITFSVVVPSIPGFAYSDPPQHLGMDIFRVAEIWVDLMNALGYNRFAVQGGDIGAGVSTALGLRHSERLIGIHLNYIPGSYHPYLKGRPAITKEEEAFLSASARWYDHNGAYAHLQGTRPQTPAYGLNDSPVGLAAWILEKFLEWSDCDGDVFKCFSKDELLTNVSLYWMTQTISSSFFMYQEGRKTPLHFSPTDRVTTPCAIAVFPREIVMPPKSWVERGYNVVRWTMMLAGGHFAAAEQPEALAIDLHDFFSQQNMV